MTTVRHLALVGPTASGKSSLAMDLARRLPDIELVSVDSMQVYRQMDIGTAKPTPEEQAEVVHHLLDIVEPTSDFALAEFQAAANRAIADIESRGKRALLVGGTGLYLQSVIDDLDLPGQYPEVRADLENESTATLYQRLQTLDQRAAVRMEPENRRRIVRALEVTVGSGRPFSSYGPGVDQFPETRFALLGLWLPRPQANARIEERVKNMIDAGWLDEVRSLPVDLSKTAAQALGYKELLAYAEQKAEGEQELAAVLDEIVRKTRAFARRQRVWFRRDPRIRWHATSSDPSRLLVGLLRDCALERSQL